jgi:Photosynthesis affected mutant 68
VTRSQLPFEPNSAKKSKKSQGQPSKSPLKNLETTKVEPSNTADTIPPEVNKRLVRRAAIFSGIPTSLGFITFIVSYIVVVKKWADLPNSAVVLVSMGFLGIGVLGLSYGVISASWDENRVGHWWGWQEFKQNFGYLRAAWKAQRAEKVSAQKPD